MPEVDLRRRLQRPELREPRSGAEVPDAVAADDSMKFIQTPAEFKLELFASEPDIVKPIAFSFDERGRLWVIEAIDYPNERAATARPATTASRSSRTPTATARPTSSPSSPTPEPRHQPRLRQRRRHRRGSAAHAVPEGHQRRRQGRRAEGAQHRLGHRATPTPGRPTCSTGPTTTSGASSATPASTAR